MGGVRKAIITEICPWSVVMRDNVASLALRAYGARERWGLMPPGRTDPRLLAAMSIIASEHDRVIMEDMPRK